MFCLLHIMAMLISQPMCLQLNERLLQPHKDDNELLVPTPLQLAPHTQLLLDETEMQQGHLTEIGCGNIEVGSI